MIGRAVLRRPIGRLGGPRLRRGADFDLLSRAIGQRYCFFEHKPVDWPAVVRHYRPRALLASGRDSSVRLYEAMLDELYDPHTHLCTHLDGSWRVPPFDLWAEPEGERAPVLEVRADSPAWRAGLRPGDTITGIDGRSVHEQVVERCPRFLSRPDPAAVRWALLSVLSGRRGRARHLVVERRGREVALALDDREPGGGGPDRLPAVRAEVLAGGCLYVRIGSFSDAATVAAFDEAIDLPRPPTAMIIDVRDNPGGDTVVTRPIMGRLVNERARFAVMCRRRGRRGRCWDEYVEPRGPVYDGPVLVLVNHWSSSAAEGFAMGLSAIGRATVVGTPMAGLGAGVLTVHLPHAGLDVQFSAEPVYHPNGEPRWEFRPDLEVDLVGGQPGDGGPPRDLILEKALGALGTLG